MNKKKIYIHIGPHKTGTTTIQRGLWINHERLSVNNYLCPRSGSASHSTIAHHNLAWEMRNVRRFNEKDGTWKDALEEISHLNAPGNVILSSEEFTNFTEQHVRELKKLMGSFQVFIICYLRRQDILLQSIWSEITKNGQNMLDFQDWLEKREYGFIFSNYEKFLSKWSSVFGKDHIILRILEKKQIEGHLFNDFLTACGVVDCESYLIPENMNVSLGIKALEIIKHYKKKLPERMPVEDIRILVKWIREYTVVNGWNGDKPNKINATTHHRIMSKFEQSNRILAKEYFGRDELFLEPYVEKEITDFRLEDYDQQDLVDLSLFITSKLISSGYDNLWHGKKNEKDLRIENQELKGEVDRIRTSWIWKLIERMHTLRGRLIK